MSFVIRHEQNRGYLKEATESWTILPLATKFPTLEVAQKQKDALERKPKYFEKIKILPEDECPENTRD